MILDLYYFDVSGKGFSLPNGLQFAYEGKNYKIQIYAFVPLAKKNRSTIYTVNLVMPQGNMPLVTVGYKLKKNFLLSVVIGLVILSS